MAKGDAQKVLGRLREDLRRWPESISSLEKKVGKSPGYFRGRWRAGSMPLDTLLETLEVMGENPVAFFARALQRPVPDELDLLASCWSDLPPIIGRALQRQFDEGPVTIRREHLDTLDEIRYDDPDRARRMAEDAIDFVDPADIPLCLGIWASAQRLQVRLEEGRAALRTGFDIATRQANGWARANLVQRAAYLVSAEGDYASALRLAERATVLFARLGDLTDVARALVDQGTFMVNLEIFDEAKGAFESAFQLLPEAERRNRCAAHFGLAVCYFGSGDLERSELELEHAKELGRSAFELGYIHRLEANLLASNLEFGAADEYFERAAECLVDISPVAAAIIGCEQVKMRLQAGWYRKAQRRAFAMVRLLERLRYNRIAEAAIRDLICCQADGNQLTIEFLEGIVRRIEPSSGQRGTLGARY